MGLHKKTIGTPEAIVIITRYYWPDIMKTLLTVLHSQYIRSPCYEMRRNIRVGNNEGKTQSERENLYNQRIQQLQQGLSILFTPTLEYMSKISPEKIILGKRMFNLNIPIAIMQQPQKQMVSFSIAPTPSSIKENMIIDHISHSFERPDTIFPKYEPFIDAKAKFELIYKLFFYHFSPFRSEPRKLFSQYSSSYANVGVTDDTIKQSQSKQSFNSDQQQPEQQHRGISPQNQIIQDQHQITDSNENIIQPNLPINKHRSISPPQFSSSSPSPISSLIPINITKLSEKQLRKLVRQQVDIILDIHNWILLERRVVVIGSNMSEISEFCSSLKVFLIPFIWKSVFIPILSYNLIDHLGMSVPSIIGVVRENVIQNTKKSQDAEFNSKNRTSKQQVFQISKEQQIKQSNQSHSFHSVSVGWINQSYSKLIPAQNTIPNALSKLCFGAAVIDLDEGSVFFPIESKENQKLVLFSYASLKENQNLKSRIIKTGFVKLYSPEDGKKKEEQTIERENSIEMQTNDKLNMHQIVQIDNQSNQADNQSIDSQAQPHPSHSPLSQSQQDQFSGSLFNPPFSTSEFHLDSSTSMQQQPSNNYFLNSTSALQYSTQSSPSPQLNAISPLLQGNSLHRNNIQQQQRLLREKQIKIKKQINQILNIKIKFKDNVAPIYISQQLFDTQAPPLIRPKIQYYQKLREKLINLIFQHYVEIKKQEIEKVQQWEKEVKKFQKKLKKQKKEKEKEKQKQKDDQDLREQDEQKMKILNLFESHFSQITNEQSQNNKTLQVPIQEQEKQQTQQQDIQIQIPIPLQYEPLQPDNIDQITLKPENTDQSIKHVDNNNQTSPLLQSESNIHNSNDAFIRISTPITPQTSSSSSSSNQPPIPPPSRPIPIPPPSMYIPYQINSYQFNSIHSISTPYIQPESEAVNILSLFFKYHIAIMQPYKESCQIIETFVNPATGVKNIAENKQQVQQSDDQKLDGENIQNIKEDEDINNGEKINIEFKEEDEEDGDETVEYDEEEYQNLYRKLKIKRDFIDKMKKYDKQVGFEIVKEIFLKQYNQQDQEFLKQFTDTRLFREFTEMRKFRLKMKDICAHLKDEFMKKEEERKKQNDLKKEQIIENEKQKDKEIDDDIYQDNEDDLSSSIYSEEYFNNFLEDFVDIEIEAMKQKKNSKIDAYFKTISDSFGQERTNEWRKRRDAEIKDELRRKRVKMKERKRFKKMNELKKLQNKQKKE